MGVSTPVSAHASRPSLALSYSLTRTRSPTHAHSFRHLPSLPFLLPQSHPLIFVSALEDGGGTYEYYAESLPLIGIASSKSGFSLFEVRVRGGGSGLRDGFKVESKPKAPPGGLQPARAASLPSPQPVPALGAPSPTPSLFPHPLILSTHPQYKHSILTIFEEHQLSQEALVARLQALRAAPPLLLHKSLKEISVSRVQGDIGEGPTHTPVSHLPPLSSPSMPPRPFSPFLPSSPARPPPPLRRSSRAT
jgi:hypothetical protein